jgi:hypothetical protein
MANNIAFQPMGKTIKIITNSSTANNLTILSDSPSNQYRLANHTALPVYVWISASGNLTNAAAPTGNGANAQYAVVVPGNTVSVITGPQCTNTTSVQVSAICESGNPDVYITPGEGL